jgi:hypothetical protein
MIKLLCILAGLIVGGIIGYIRGRIATKYQYVDIILLDDYMLRTLYAYSVAAHKDHMSITVPHVEFNRIVATYNDRMRIPAISVHLFR